MALPETLPASSFADFLQIEDVQFSQSFQQQRSATAGGETHYADRAPSLWKAVLTTIAVPNADAEGIMALINSRAGGLKTVLLYNSRMPFPADDPEGAIIGSTIPKLGAITDRLHIAFTGFPAGYKMRTGSYFGLISGDLYYLGQFAEDRTATGGGAIASVEIWPPLPASISGTPNISIKKPAAKFRITPGSAYPSRAGSLHSIIRLSAEQTYR